MYSDYSNNNNTYTIIAMPRAANAREIFSQDNVQALYIRALLCKYFSSRCLRIIISDILVQA